MQSTQPAKRFAMSRRGVAALVIAGHVAIIYIIATSLGFVEAPKFAEPIPETPIEVPVEEPSVVASDVAIAAIRKWTFAPAMRGAQPVPAWTTVRVTFQLDS